jgi:two-component system sporulation sensor kinase A
MAKISDSIGAMYEQLLKSFMTHSSDGIVVVDLEGKVLDVNRAFETMHGWTKEEVLGTVLPMTPPHLLDEARKLHELVLSGKSVNGYETFKMKKDGSMFHASVTISPVVDAEGSVIALVGVERDITGQKLAEKQLMDSEERYRQLVEFSPEPIMAIADYYVFYANPAALNLIGGQHIDEIQGKCFLDFIHPVHAVQLSALLEQAIGDKLPSDIIPVKLVRFDRQLVDAELKIVPMLSPGNTSVQLLFRDISKRKTAEQSLQETEMLYECLVENAMAGVYLYQDEKMVYVNPYLSKLFGYSRDEMMQSKLQTFIFADDLTTFKEIAVQTLEERISAFPFSIRGMKKDRSIVYLEGLVTLTKYKGKPSLLGTFQDVTYKNEVEEALRENALRYQRLIKFLPEPIVVSDAGMLIYANKSAMKLFRTTVESDLVGKSMYHFIHPEHQQEAMKIERNVMKTDNPSQFKEIRIICFDGEVIEAEISSIRIHHYMGKTVTLTVLRDITDRKQAEEMMIRSEKLSIVGQLAAGLAHEIRNPLTSLKGFTQLLKSKSKEDSFYYDTMLTELERINLIVGDFMTLAKPQLSQFGYGSVSGMLEHVISVLNHQAILMNVSLISKVSSALPDIYCDENQLKQVFINLIKNAIEAMPQGGNVVIAADQINAETICVKIKDQGDGIPDAIVHKLGEPFLTTKTNGTGLGLMISYRIVEHHRGSIKICSKDKQGTTVKLLLPVPEGQPRREPAADSDDWAI